MIICINIPQTICSKQEHLHYLEDTYGFNIDCNCDNRTKLLIDYGVYDIKNSEDNGSCMYSCRMCQYDRMMNNPECTFRIP